jgi:quercetin dioxygenase-like cupin family protein
MDAMRFERALRDEGFSEIETKSVAGGTHNDEHAHAFEARALVLQGEIALTVAGESRTYREGDVFTMPAGCRHIEDVGPGGVSYVLGRRRADPR